jgi:hypothetical protein
MEVMSALHSLRIPRRQSRNIAIHMSLLSFSATPTAIAASSASGDQE